MTLIEIMCTNGEFVFLGTALTCKDLFRSLTYKCTLKFWFTSFNVYKSSSLRQRVGRLTAILIIVIRNGVVVSLD